MQGLDPLILGSGLTAGRTLAAIFLSVLAIYLLNFVFYSNPGDLQAEFKPTLRCYPGGTCYSVGLEQWGGFGALLLMTVNLFQGILIFNAAAGIWGLYKNYKRIRTAT